MHTDPEYYSEEPKSYRTLSSESSEYSDYSFKSIDDQQALEIMRRNPKFDEYSDEHIIKCKNTIFEKYASIK